MLTLARAKRVPLRKPVDDHVGLHLAAVVNRHARERPARRGSRGMSIDDLLCSYGHLIGLFCFSSLPLLAGRQPFLGCAIIRTFSARRRPLRRSISSCQFRQSKLSGGIMLSTCSAKFGTGSGYARAACPERDRSRAAAALARWRCWAAANDPAHGQSARRRAGGDNHHRAQPH